MKKLILLLTLTLMPILNVFADTSAKVNNQTELKQALEDTNITTIILESDIETTEKINITRPVTIDGNNHTMKYIGTFGSESSKANTTWGGIYLLQVYKTNATIKNIKLTGGNAALLANGSSITLEGTIDVSGNGFGGIELSQGKNVTEQSRLTLINNAKIINTTESENTPTLWVPSDSQPAILSINGEEVTINPSQELSLEEIANLFESKTETPEQTDTLEEENPKTSDPILLAIIIVITGVTTLVLTTKRIITNK